MKFEDRSHQETERQERCAQSKAWNLAKNNFKLKEKDKTAFYSPAEKTPGCVNERAEGKRVCGGFWSEYAHDQQDETLTPPCWRPLRTSRSPDDGDDGQR